MNQKTKEIIGFTTIGIAFIGSLVLAMHFIMWTVAK